ncbi:MAG TPA: M20/M25/M40 family metallo-hydrolase [Pyrinomonadaceae bacterium]|nr:M20/M25/M40 family metallo-hydrolase [Pyrinomonadaceae bacterium]
MITKARSLQGFLLVLALTASAFAQQPSASQPSVNRLRQIVEYLASDTLEGRRTGTAGAKDAAHYIAGEFSLLGLRPGMQLAQPTRTRGENRARYLQSFPYVADVTLGKNNVLLLNGRPVEGVTARVGEDWAPLGFSSNASVPTSPVVFAGYGISSAELKYDDYAVSNAKDRIAIVFAGTPDGDNPHGQFTQAGQIRFKVAAARAAGARALLIIANEEKLNDDRLSRLSYDNAGEAGMPVLVVSRQLARKLIFIPNPEMTLAEFEKLEADARKFTNKPEPKPAQTPSDNSIRQEFSFSPLLSRTPIEGLSVSLTTDVVRREAPSFNVVGILAGSDPKLKNESIVIGAHYDHLGRGGAGSLAPSEGEIHHGADDNASGVAGLLELARMMAQGPKPRRTIVFIAFSGEEEGLIGSNHYVNHPVVPLANTVAMINLDMIGRLKEKNLILGGVGTAQEWRSMIDVANMMQSVTLWPDPTTRPASMSERPMVVGANGRPVVTTDPAKRFSLTLNEDGFGPSDHSSFYGKQIPVLFFWTGTHNDYHKPSDTAEKINYEGEARIVSFAASIIRDVDKSDKRPTYTVAKVASTGRSTGFRIYLGTIPNYAESNDGLLIDGVRDDSPAAKGGLKAGDKIVKIAGRDVKNVYDYTYALGEMKAGQEYEVEVVRGSERLTLKITPEARK